MYKVVISKKILKSLDKIPVVYLSSIKEAVNGLANNPRPLGCVKLVGFEKLYRIRVGVFRIIYSIEDNVLTVEVAKIDHRGSVYK
ncbi:MAG: type II toxin-antitoxin system RelE/ParE family toxin [Prevotellaceae bacterium]|nr:type II toxin-antitoxin system RelE/ParE family toxin [Prevotellaceae bacterium]